MNDTPKSLEIDPPLPTSAQIRARLEAAKVRFHANDNIAAFMREGELEELKVEVLDAGFAYDGKTWRSLSAIAREVSGTSWNGFLFFGLQSRAKTTGGAE